MATPSDIEISAGPAVALRRAPIAGKSPSRLFWERLRQDRAALAGGVSCYLLEGSRMSDNLVEVEHLTKRFAVKQGCSRAGRRRCTRSRTSRSPCGGARRSASSASRAAASRPPPG